ncbi:hypothetical protein QBD00_004323 [Ochrobactrum sp. AN78]|nr:hypothetical protein [Ochrobactrum sp. AN78]
MELRRSFESCLDRAVQHFSSKVGPVTVLDIRARGCRKCDLKCSVSGFDHSRKVNRYFGAAVDRSSNLRQTVCSSDNAWNRRTGVAACHNATIDPLNNSSFRHADSSPAEDRRAEPGDD